MHKITNCSIPVPCGRCPECLKKRISGWVFRLQQEYKRSQTAHFVTLTYDTKHVPITDALYMSLKKEDVQKFMKRLRKSLEKSHPQLVIKYYLCGEYGSDTNRPHYHAIIYNVPDWSYIEKAWQLGAIHYGEEVNEATMAYTCKYMDKPKRIPLHRNDDRQPEFSLMSKGLGENYVNEESKKYHLADLTGRTFLSVSNGTKIGMPRYYKNKIYHENQLQAIAAYQKKEADLRLDKAQQTFQGEYFHKKFISDKEKFRKQESSQQKRNKI